MILPNGCFCLIREKSTVRAGQQPGCVCDGTELLIVADYWRNEADYEARPDRPRGSWAHIFRLKPLPEDFETELLTVLCSHAINEQIDHGPHHVWRRAPKDPHGWLSHPHVKALEVTPYA